VRIYLASSWRNKEYPRVLKLLRDAGHFVYDFRTSETAFAWEAIDPKWETWSSAQYREALTHPLARAGFEGDMDALTRCEACVLLLPCGRSAHIEAGYAAGQGKRLIVLTDSSERPELMYSMGRVALDDRELLAWLR
jgi:nucleoside 2-deoxyribosyltransferase